MQCGALATWRTATKSGVSTNGIQYPCAQQGEKHPASRIDTGRGAITHWLPIRAATFAA